MKIIFYKYIGEYRLINKTLGNGITIEGRVNYTLDINNPTIELNSRNSKFDYEWNYCYIHELDKYYFIQRYAVQSNSAFIVHLNIDLLKTYESDILNSTGTLIVSEEVDKFNSDVVEVYNTKPKVDILQFDVTEPFNKDGDIIIVAIKGSQSETT